LRIGYTKIGRAWNLDPANWSSAGGDMDMWRLLQRLAVLYPDVEWVLVGRNSGEEPQSVGLPANVTNPWLQWTPQYKQDRSAWGKRGGQTQMASDNKFNLISWYDQYTLDTFRGLDGILSWAGQHGTSNSPLPPIGGTWDAVTSPQDSAVIYGSYVVRGINAFRQADPLAREEVWLCPDPRNYVKARDLKWPMRHPVLAQYREVRQTKFERYGDPRTPQECGFANIKCEGTAWVTKVPYEYSALELTMLPTPDEIPPNTVPGDIPFGLIVNENRPYVAHSRLRCMKEWVLPYWPEAPIFGKWSAEAEKELGRKIEMIPVLQMYDVLRRFRCTFTMPASGTRWATGKAWEAFATGVLCFFHPLYDDQGHIIPTLKQAEAMGDHPLAHLARWLRPQTPGDLYARVTQLAQDDDTWRWLANIQRQHFVTRFNERRIERMIAQRLGLPFHETVPCASVS
jgi:hypothetical protein